MTERTIRRSGKHPQRTMAGTFQSAQIHGMPLSRSAYSLELLRLIPFLSSFLFSCPPAGAGGAADPAAAGAPARCSTTSSPPPPPSTPSRYVCSHSDAAQRGLDADRGSDQRCETPPRVRRCFVQRTQRNTAHTPNACVLSRGRRGEVCARAGRLRIPNHVPSITLFYGSFCANNGKGDLTPQNP
eukprot:9040653-Pyramimonas_sp.AAC.3